MSINLPKDIIRTTALTSVIERKNTTADTEFPSEVRLAKIN